MSHLLSIALLDVSLDNLPFYFNFSNCRVIDILDVDIDNWIESSIIHYQKLVFQH